MIQEFIYDQYLKERIAQEPMDYWRMNLIQFDYKRMVVYLAMKYSIRLLKIGNMIIQESTQRINLEQDNLINQIKLYKDKLYAVTMNANIYIIDLIDFKQVKLQAKYKDIEDCSVWSIDISDNYLIVGSNSTIISLWNIKAIEFTQNYDYLLEDYDINNHYTKEELNDDNKLKRFSIIHHKHNIPCVKISPCQKYISSGSIDSILRIFLIEDGSLITQYKCSEWIWCIDWGYRDNIQKYSEQLEKYFLIIGLPKSIQILHYQDKKIVQKIHILENNINFQRYQALKYFEQVNLIMAIPFHSNYTQFFELQIQDNQIYYKQHNLQLNQQQQEQILAADIVLIDNSKSLMLATYSYQGFISIYKISIAKQWELYKIL